MKWNQDDFKKRLFALMRAKGWNQSDFAVKVNKSPGAVSRWLNPTDNNIPPLETICEIAEAMRVRPSVIAFADDHEAMDDEEVEIVESWRRMSEGERHSFTALFKEITKARKEPLKKTRVKRAKPADAPQKSIPLPALLTELNQAREELTQAIHQLFGENPLNPAFSSVAKRLDRLVESLVPESPPASTAPESSVAAAGAVPAGNSESPSTPQDRTVLKS